MSLDPELTERLKRVLAALEPLLPAPAAPIDWAACHAANWRRRPFSGALEPVPSVEAMHLDVEVFCRLAAAMVAYRAADDERTASGAGAGLKQA